MTPIATAFDDSFSGLSIKSGLTGGVMAFDQWDDDFWKEMHTETLKTPAGQSRQNSCNAADPVNPN